MIAKINSCAVVGMDAMAVEVEVDISYGLPVFHMVGLAEASVRESKERVRAAITNSGYTFPMDRVVVNLAPADLKKEGTALDLPIALGVLMGSGLISRDAARSWVVSGELSLDGSIKPVKAALPHALAARDQGYKGIIVPHGNADEAAMVQGIDIIPAARLSEVVEFLTGIRQIEPHLLDVSSFLHETCLGTAGDFSEIRGQAHVKRALEIAAAGGHHVLMSGPPGSGKSMLAKRLPFILPRPGFGESMEIARIYSVAGEFKEVTGGRPFRSPHHTISYAGLVGGGSKPVPGEISLAHHGVLFLDELPEFKRSVLEVLRQPLEEGRVTISRAGIKVGYPCKFMLVGAMNPCACGNFGNPSKACTCSPARIRQYRARISGPLLDRMDIQVEVPQISYEQMAGDRVEESSSRIRERVARARKIQNLRLENTGVFSNSGMLPSQVKKYCGLKKEASALFKRAMDQLGFSARSYTSILKVARTIADLGEEENISRHHILEAVQYKNLGREGNL